MFYSPEITGKVIKNEREKRGWSQKLFGEKIGVTGKQISNYEAGVLMPPMDILAKMCDVFDCEMGYLLNEESYSDGTKFMTAINNEIGLNKETVKSLKHITGNEKSCVDFGYNSGKNRRIINMFLSSAAFGNFFESLSDLDQMVERRNNVWKELEDKYTKELVDKGMTYYNSSTDYCNDPNAEKLDDKMYDVLLDIDRAIDKVHDYTYSIKVARYELNEAFQELINAIYPKNE